MNREIKDMILIPLIFGIGLIIINILFLFYGLFLIFDYGNHSIGSIFFSFGMGYFDYIMINTLFRFIKGDTFFHKAKKIAPLSIFYTPFCLIFTLWFLSSILLPLYIPFFLIDIIILFIPSIMIKKIKIALSNRESSDINWSKDEDRIKELENRKIYQEEIGKIASYRGKDSQSYINWKLERGLENNYKKKKFDFHLKNEIFLTDDIDFSSEVLQRLIIKKVSIFDEIPIAIYHNFKGTAEDPIIITSLENFPKKIEMNNQDEFILVKNVYSNEHSIKFKKCKNVMIENSRFKHLSAEESEIKFYTLRIPIASYNSKIYYNDKEEK